MAAIANIASEALVGHSQWTMTAALNAYQAL
jgi:hypothetical protein